MFLHYCDKLMIMSSLRIICQLIVIVHLLVIVQNAKYDFVGKHKEVTE